MMTKTSTSSELLSVKLLTDRTASVSLAGGPAKRVGGLDAISWLRSIIPQLRNTLREGSEEITGYSEIKMGRYLVSMRDKREDGSVKTLFLYRPESPGQFRLEFNTSGGSPLEVYTRYIQGLINHYGIETLNAMLQTIGGSLDPAKRTLTLSSLLYPNLACEYDITRISEVDERGVRKFGVQGNCIYRATSTPLTSVWATTSSMSTLPNKFNIPLSNFFSEGTMCFGTINRVDKFLDNGNFRQFDYYLDILMTSNYNFDLCHQGHTSRFIEYNNQHANRHFHNFLKRFDKYDERICDPDQHGVYAEYRRYLDLVFHLADPSTRTFPYALFGA